MSRAAKRYAKAVLELAKSKNQLEAVLSDMDTIDATLSASKDLRMALQNPIVKSDAKTAILKKVFAQSSKETHSLFETLVANNRADILGQVARSAVAIHNEHIGKREATVTTAIPLTPELEAKVLAKVKVMTGSTLVTLTNEIDEDLIGGFIVRAGDLQYDASVSAQLNKIRKEFSNRL